MSDEIEHLILKPSAADRLQALQRAFRRAPGRWRLTRSTWRRLRWGVLARLVVVVLGIGAAAFGFHGLSAQFGSPALALRHVLAVANCDAVRAQGLAPARRGAPGYYVQHDRDGDGVACEVWSR